MATVQCPLFDKPFYSYTIDLTKETYTLRFRWNSRLEQWLMDVDDAEENNLIRGVSLVPDYPLIQQFSLEKPSGQFFLVPVGQDSMELRDSKKIYDSHFLFYVDGV